MRRHHDESSIPPDFVNGCFFSTLLKGGVYVTFSKGELVDEIIKHMGCARESGRYGMESNDGSPSSSGSRYEFFLMGEGSILRIGVPYDAFWYEAYVTKINEFGYDSEKARIDKFSHLNSCLECVTHHLKLSAQTNF